MLAVSNSSTRLGSAMEVTLCLFFSSLFFLYSLSLLFFLLAHVFPFEIEIKAFQSVLKLPSRASISFDIFFLDVGLYTAAARLMSEDSKIRVKKT
jgi:hypothetical protein